MLKTWWSHLKGDKQEQERFKRRVLECQDVITRLHGICNQKIESSNKNMRKSTNLCDPSWTHYVAGELGYQRALEELIELTEISKNE